MLGKSFLFNLPTAQRQRCTEWERIEDLINDCKFHEDINHLVSLPFSCSGMQEDQKGVRINHVDKRNNVTVTQTNSSSSLIAKATKADSRLHGLLLGEKDFGAGEKRKLREERK